MCNITDDEAYTKHYCYVSVCSCVCTSIISDDSHLGLRLHCVPQVSILLHRDCDSEKVFTFHYEISAAKLTLLASQTESVTVMTVVTAMIRANFQYHCRVHRITV